MTLLLPAADRVVREAVEAMLDGRTRPGAGSDISFATRSSRYRVIHGLLREATDGSLVGARFVGWLFDGTSPPRVTERWETDARAVLLDEAKGQIVVTSITRVHVANALAAGEGVELPATQLDGSGFPSRASTLHGMAAIDPEPEAARPPAPPPAAGAPALGASPTAPQQPSPMPRKLTIPPAPPIPGRQNTPVPQGRPATPPHPGMRTQPMGTFTPPSPPLTPPLPPPPPPVSYPTAQITTPPGTPSRPQTPLGLGPRTLLGVAAATRPPPAAGEDAAPPHATSEASAASSSGGAAASGREGDETATPPPAVVAPPDAPLPQFDLDDLDDMPTRADPSPPVKVEVSSADGLEEVSAEMEIDPPSSDDGASIIPLVSRPTS